MSDLSYFNDDQHSNLVEGMDDLLVVILSFLDIIELTRKKTVCKRWENICAKVFDKKYPPSTMRKPFSTVKELEIMAKKYKDAKNFESTHKADEIGRVYGWPMSKWNVSQIGYDFSKAQTYLEQGIWNDYDSTLRYFCTHTLTLMMTSGKIKVRETINIGLVPRLVEFLSYQNEEALLEETCWALSHVTSGTTKEIKKVVDEGAIPSFCRLLLSPNHDVYEYTLLALGNIANNKCTLYRDLVLQANIMQPLLERIHQIPKTTSWVLSKLCRGKPHPDYQLIKQAIPAVRQLLLYNNCEEVLEDICRTLFYLSDMSDFKKENELQGFLNAEVVRRLVQLLQEKSSIHILKLVINTITNLIRGNNLQIQAFIDADILPILSAHLSDDFVIQKETCSIISAITGGNGRQIQAVIESNIIQNLSLLMLRRSLYSKMDASRAICNAISGGSPKQVRVLIREGCTPLLCQVLSTPSNENVIIVLLEAIEKILKVSEEDDEIDENLIASYLSEIGGLDYVEDFLEHTDNNIKSRMEKCIRILQVYYDTRI